MKNNHFPDLRTVRLTMQSRAAAFLNRPAASRRLLAAAAVLVLLACPSPASAQITNTVFSDDFADGVIDPAKYQPDAPFFEGGQGDIHATEANGVLEFTGTVSQQWNSGGLAPRCESFRRSPFPTRPTS